MKSLQDYINIYYNIAKNLNLQGDSVELLVQLLANASFINEVENLSYVKESSLEKATLINSKIQHCMNEMYSVFRGSCPRVIINFKPNKYFNFNLFDEIISSNNFKIYYIGYLNEGISTLSSNGTSIISNIEGFNYSPLTIPPAIENESYTIIGIVSKEIINKTWNLDQKNTYYVNCLEDNLSNDMWVKVNDNYFDVTREFSDHILNNKIFDLTLPSFGSRLYVADIFKSTVSNDEVSTPSNTKIEANYFKYSDLTSYNEIELKKISLKGAELIKFDEDFLSKRGLKELSTGISYVESIPSSDINTIHYKANRDRYVNSIIRSNSDIGTVLEEMYPNKVRPNGTSYIFETSSNNNIINVYYVPYDNVNLLTDLEIQEFIEKRSVYYITDSINVQKGILYSAVITIDVELYQNSVIDSEVENILSSYENKFNISLNDSLEEIKSLISKISNVKQIINLNITYIDEAGNSLNESEINNIDTRISYFNINYVINSIIKS